MRYFTLIALWLIAFVPMNAQEEEERRLSINGQLLDADLKEPIV